MEKIIKGEVITLDNDKDYVVTEIIDQDKKTYLYLVREDLNEIMIAEEVHEGKEIFIDAIEDKNKMVELSHVVMTRQKLA